jgi:hypothetical protein
MREHGRQIGAASVLADDDRGDTLADHGEALAMIDQTTVVMTVRVDESWRERESVGVNNALARAWGQRADGDDPVTVDSNIRSATGTSGPVDDAGVANERSRRGLAVGGLPRNRGRQEAAASDERPLHSHQSWRLLTPRVERAIFRDGEKTQL